MEKKIGKVTHYYDRIGVAVLELQDALKLGDTIHIVGRRTEIVQQVSSLEIEHRKVQAVGAGADVALKVYEEVHEGDEIYRIT
jgi:putative protease